MRTTKKRSALGYLAPDKSIHFFRLNSQVRAAAFEEAGANMILIYSKETTEVEVESFVKAWNRLPLRQVPIKAAAVLRFDPI
jgi:hypothetical protein